MAAYSPSTAKLPLMRGNGGSELFSYRQLATDELRILVIEPGRSNDPLRGIIAHRKLGDPGNSYTALSYVWGSSKRNRILHMCGSGQYVKITKNAEKMLLSLRHQKEERRVWIDGICINQDDLTERSHQVTLMGHIFSGAFNVLIWLGESDKYTATAFEALHDIHQRHLSEQKPAIQADELTFGSQSEQDSVIVTRLNGMAPPGHKDVKQEMDKWATIRTVSERPWFCRAWTFQEACLSPNTNMRCGHHEIPWMVFVSAALYLNAHGMSGVFGTKADTIALAYFAAANPSRQVPSLSTVLPLTRSLKATDPRDKVFSLLGMVDKAGLPPVPTSYHLPPAIVYSAVAKATIVQERGLSVLSSVCGPSPDRSLPSWVPDWRLPRGTAMFHGYDWPSPSHLYEINKGAPFENTILTDLGVDTRVLPVRAARIDSIVRVLKPTSLLRHLKKAPLSRSLLSESRLNAWLHKLEKILNRICAKLRLDTYSDYGPKEAPLSPKRDSGEPGRVSVPEALLKTLTAERGGVGEEVLEWSRKFGTLLNASFVKNEWRWWWPKALGLGGDSRDVASPLMELELSVKLLATAMLTFLTGRVIFTTSTGLIGIVCSGARVRDEVWNIVGGYVPFVLRQAGPGDRPGVGAAERRLTLVGEAYVHGIMRGGLWQCEPSETSSICRAAGRRLDFEDVGLI